VILSWIKGSGADVPGTVYAWGERNVNAGGVTTFGRHAVVSENRLTALPEGVPLREAALLGCAVPTGFGSVLNAAAPRPGQSIAIFGDRRGWPVRRLSGGAGRLHADHRRGREPVQAAGGERAWRDPYRQQRRGGPDRGAARDLPGGVDFAIEASGRPSVMMQALGSVRSQGGGSGRDRQRPPGRAG